MVLAVDDSPSLGVARRRVDASRLAAGFAVTAALAVAATGTPRAWEVEAFQAINGLSHYPERVLWAVQQLGAVWAVPVGAVVLWRLARRWQPPVALLASAAILGWGVANLLREIVARERPGAMLEGVQIGYDVPAVGNVFPSGHAIVVMALLTVLAPYLSRRLIIVGLAAATAVMLLRIYVGAHLPLDVLGGAAYGVAVGSLANLAGGVFPREPGLMGNP